MIGSRPRDGDDTRPASTEAAGKNLHAGGTCVPNRLFLRRSSLAVRSLYAVNKHFVQKAKVRYCYYLFIHNINYTHTHTRTRMCFDTVKRKTNTHNTNTLQSQRCDEKFYSGKGVHASHLQCVLHGITMCILYIYTYNEAASMDENENLQRVDRDRTSILR